ncbi:MAG: hypothetical protein WCK47_00775 [bacterium]
MTENADRYDPLRDSTDRFEPLPDHIDYSIPGDLVMIYPGDTRPKIVVRTRREKADWIPVPEHPSENTVGRMPTAIEYGGHFWEIIRIQPHGSSIEYHLAPWREGEIHRRVISYSRKAEMSRQLNQADYARFVSRVRRLRLLYPLIGLLPNGAQVALAERWGIDPGAATLWSCAFEALVAVYFIFFGFVVAAIGAFVTPDSAAHYVPERLLGLPGFFWTAIAPLLLLEAIVRWRLLATRGRFHGNCLLEFIWKILP